MRAEIWAALTAVCWGAGSMLEKKGVHLGSLAPIMGTTLRTAFSLLLLAAISYPLWSQARTAGIKSISLIAVGGGVMAGGLGIVFLYTGLKHGNLSSVMTIAFCLAPVVSAILGFLVLRERLTPPQLVGIVLCVSGAALVSYFRAA